MFQIVDHMQDGFAEEVMRRLSKRYSGQWGTMLRNESMTELFVATLLSPQCTDKQVNNTTTELFKRFRSFKEYADADTRELTRYLKGLNFYKTKARNLSRAARMIVDRFDGELPRSINDLMLLPGVGRKVANVILTNGFGITEGIAVDTHVIVIANRLGLTRSRKPEMIERDLMRRIPKRYWRYASNLFIALGRDVCTKLEKKCYGCSLNDICPSSNFVLDKK
jgi:endonuclease-3